MASFQIDKQTMQAVSVITAVMDIENLGPRQQATLKRYLKTGVITAEGAPAKMARAIRVDAGLPTISVSQWRYRHDCIPRGDHPVREQFAAFRTMYITQNPSSGPATSYSMKGIDAVANGERDFCRFYYKDVTSQAMLRALMEAIKLPAIALPASGKITVTLYGDPADTDIDVAGE